MQKKVRANLGNGIPGQILKGEHNYLFLAQGEVASDNVHPGGFLQSVANNPGQVKNATGAAISGSIVGVCTLSKYVSSEATPVDNYKSGDVTYAMKGAIWIKTKVACSEGQFVFLKTDDGTLAFDNSATKTNHTYTGWKVLIGTGAAVDTDLKYDVIAIVKE